MNKERIFTSDELRELETGVQERIERAIDSGDYEKAKELIRNLYQAAMGAHDHSCDTIALFLSFIARRLGDEAVKEATEEWVADVTRASAEMYEQIGDAKTRASLFAEGVKGHFRPIEISEDDDKFIFKMKPCGSGGRMVLEGKYGPPPKFHKIRKAQPMTCWREDFPVYCIHAHIMAAIAVSSGLTPFALEIPAEKIGEEPCEIWLFKDPKSIPAEAYKKVGILPEAIPKGA